MGAFKHRLRRVKCYIAIQLTICFLLLSAGRVETYLKPNPPHRVRFADIVSTFALVVVVVVVGGRDS